MMQMVCPIDWEALDPSADPAVRHCKQCDEDVHLCTTPARFIEMARRKECVALPASLHIPDDASTKVQMLGRPAPWSYQLEKSAAHFWSVIQEDAADVDGQTRTEMAKCKARRMLRMHDEEPSTNRNKWSPSQIELVKKAAAKGVREELAFESVGIVEKASDFVEAMTPLQDAGFEIAPRQDALKLLTSNPDLSLKQFMSLEIPAMHAQITFADIDGYVPAGPGIYQIWTIWGEALKVGISTNLRKRLRKHRASRDSGLKPKPGGDPGTPDGCISKASILAKHLYFDQTLAKEFDLTKESERKRFLDEYCRITFRPTNSKEEARALEKELEQRSGMFRYQGRVRRR
jgi:hypothetical protein